MIGSSIFWGSMWFALREVEAAGGSGAGGAPSTGKCLTDLDALGVAYTPTKARGVVDAVAQYRRPGAPQHPLNRLAAEYADLVLAHCRG